MPDTVTDLDEAAAAIDQQKVDLREQERTLNARRAAAEKAAHDQQVRAYWAKRAKADPDDPDVLRARAALLDRDAAAGAAVSAKPASVKGRAH